MDADDPHAETLPPADAPQLTPGSASRCFIAWMWVLGPGALVANPPPLSPLPRMGRTPPPRTQDVQAALDSEAKELNQLKAAHEKLAKDAEQLSEEKDRAQREREVLLQSAELLKMRELELERLNTDLVKQVRLLLLLHPGAATRLSILAGELASPSTMLRTRHAGTACRCCLPLRAPSSLCAWDDPPAARPSLPHSLTRLAVAARTNARSSSSR